MKCTEQTTNLLMFLSLVLLCSCLRSIRTEMACPNDPSTFCASSYRIIISITPPTHLTYTSGTSTGQTPISLTDALSYVIELREASTANIAEVGFINRGGVANTVTNALKVKDNASTNCDRLLYHTHAGLNNSQSNGTGDGAFLRYGELPLVTTDEQNIVSYSFVLHYYPTKGDTSWNTDAAIRPGNYLHARIYTLLENHMSDVPSVSQERKTENGVHFDDVLSFAEITPQPPTVTNITLGLVMADGDLEDLEAALPVTLLEGQEVAETNPVVTLVFRADGGEKMLKVPSSARKSNLNRIPQQNRFPNADEDGDGYMNVSVSRHNTMQDDKGQQCVVGTSGGGEYGQTNILTSEDIPTYFRVLSTLYTFNETQLNNIEKQVIRSDKLWLVYNFYKTTPQVQAMLATNEPVDLDPVNRFFFQCIKRLVNNGNMGALFIPSKILMVKNKNKNEYQFETYIKQFGNKIPSGSTGTQNETEYNNNVSQYTQTSNTQNLQKSIGFVGNQQSLTCRVEKLRSRSRELSNSEKMYSGGYYDDPIRNVFIPNHLQQLFTGYIYYKTTFETA